MALRHKQDQEDAEEEEAQRSLRASGSAVGSGVGGESKAPHEAKGGQQATAGENSSQCKGCVCMRKAASGITAFELEVRVATTQCCALSSLQSSSHTVSRAHAATNRICKRERSLSHSAAPTLTKASPRCCRKPPRTARSSRKSPSSALSRTWSAMAARWRARVRKNFSGPSMGTCWCESERGGVARVDYGAHFILLAHPIAHARLNKK